MEGDMCDYSLESLHSRNAASDDELVVTSFRNSTTRGFTVPGKSDVAVCLLPGTEVAFDRPITTDGFWAFSFLGLGQGRYTTAVFRKINPNNPATHHDALELPDGHIVLLTRLRPGQKARVVQLPAGVDAGHDHHHDHDHRHVQRERVATTPVAERV
jgi:hypothetical protein